MKKITVVLVAFLLVFTSTVKADEGMWLLNLIGKNYQEMKEQGFKLTAEDIFSVNKASLKDAIVVFGGGCTGEIISQKGLLLTNHHCGYSYIQQHSAVGQDYLMDGFWAATLQDEIPTPGASVKFLRSLTEVTSEVLSGIKDGTKEAKRQKKIEKIKEGLIEKAKGEDKHLHVEVKSFFGGNQYFLLIYDVFNDVRMVGAPPSSIGKYGGDTDNWMWPRHTGDFSLFRVYSNKDNKPANYSADNVPYNAPKHLPVSLKGVQPGDFTLIMGNPGSTDRYATSWEVKNIMEVTNDNRAKIRGIRQGILKEDMLADQAIRIKYATKFARSSNYWKYSIEQNKSLKQLKVMDKKVQIEKEFAEWVKQNPDREKKYGKTLSLIEKASVKLAPYQKVRLYLIECFLMGTEVLMPALNAMEIFEGKKGTVNPEAVERVRATLKNFYKDYNTSTDKKVALAMFALYQKDIPEAMHPEVFQMIKKQLGGNTDKFVESMFTNSMFSTEEKAMRFLDDPKMDEFMADPVVFAAQSIYGKFKRLKDETKEYTLMKNRGRRLFQDAYAQIYTDKALYPDANFTMRVTYGKVDGYAPRDAVDYHFQTTLKGVMQKEDPTNPEFIVHPKLKSLYKAKDFGQYALKGKEKRLPTCFLTNHDITGGNSGSPVIDGEGRLVGLAFDGNSEAMSGDILFDKSLQRTINVDIRYVLFIIDKFAGATRLIDEMELVK